MTGRRVVVTGAGSLTALGHNLSSFWEALKAGRAGIARIEGIDGELRQPNGAQVRGFQPLEHFHEKELLFLDRFAQLGLVAAKEAVVRAGIGWTEEERQRTAVVTGTSPGGRGTEEQGYADLYGRNKPRVSPLTIPRGMGNAATSQIAMHFGLRGPA